MWLLPMKNCVQTDDADRGRDRVSHLSNAASSAACLRRLSRQRHHSEGRTSHPVTYLR